ncbi:MAG: DUF2254 domain-containing protein [Chloroflexi bacterium]|nr:DUF2254 domain-containing protein [Chloroflexota bacterium]
MRARIIDRWDAARASYWFVPTIMALGAVAAAALSLDLDRRVGPDALRTVFTGSAEGARSVLSVIATAMITVAGVTFAIALAAMTLASSQFGPRLLRNFMRDLGNQFVLGTFLATFVFSLLVLGAIRGPDEGAPFVPEVSFNIAVIATLASTMVLIYFIHHAATMIQVAHIVSSATADLVRDVDRLFPPAAPDAAPHDPWQPAGPGAPALATEVGYVEVIDLDGLARTAEHRDIVIRLVGHPGSFVVTGDVLAEVWPAERANEQARRSVAGHFIMGPQRTEQQDVGFTLQQLVQVALRALSPAINDPFTAAMCVDRLGAVLSRIVVRPVPPAERLVRGRVRIIAPPPTFEHLVDSAFGEIRRNGRSQLGLTIRLLLTLEGVARRAVRAEDRALIAAEARLVMDGFATDTLLPDERRRLEVAHRSCIAASSGPDRPGVSPAADPAGDPAPADASTADGDAG